MTKPHIVVSRCLGYEACRYNGGMVFTDWNDELAEKADVVTVCPEVLAGLGTPRLPINLHRVDGRVHVIQDESNVDWTDALVQASKNFLSTVGEVDGFILKSKSPSCGLGTTPIRYGDSVYIASGVFARKAMEMHKNAAFTDETTIDEEGLDAFLEEI